MGIESDSEKDMYLSSHAFGLKQRIACEKHKNAPQASGDVGGNAAKIDSVDEDANFDDLKEALEEMAEMLKLAPRSIELLGDFPNYGRPYKK